MKSVQVTRRSTARRRVLAAGALSAIVGLASIDSALAVTCAANTFTTAGQSDCTACPAGTTAAATPTAGTASFCEGIAANYYGTAGNAASAHATVTACPANTGNGASTSNQLLATCTTAAGYYISASSGVTGTAGTVTAAPAGYHAAGGVAVDTRTANEVWNGYADSFSSATGSALTQCTAGTYSAATAATSSATCTACTATFSNAGHAGSSFTSDAASTSSSDCVTKAGFYIQTPSSTAANVIVKAVPANKYSLGGASLTATSDTKLKDCPTGFTNSAGAGTARETCKKTVSASATGTTDTYTTSTNTELIACPEGTINDPAPTAGIPSFCWKTAAGYYGAQGTKGIAAAQPQGPCPANSNSPAGSTDMTACTCNSGYSLAVAAGDFTCVADTPTASTPTAAEESAGAAMPIAAAVAAMAMPLLI